MTNKERLADIKRIRDAVALGVHDFDHTDVEGLLAELDKRDEEIKYLWDKCEGHDRNVLTTGLRIANYERLAEAVTQYGGNKLGQQWKEILDALAKCEPEETMSEVPDKCTDCEMSFAKTPRCFKGRCPKCAWGAGNRHGFAKGDSHGNHRGRHAGIIVGIRRYAWSNSDGVQYVGTCGTTLERAIEKANEELNRTAPEENDG